MLEVIKPHSSLKFRMYTGYAFIEICITYRYRIIRNPLENFNTTSLSVAQGHFRVTKSPLYRSPSIHLYQTQIQSVHPMPQTW